MPAALAADLSCANCARVMRRFSITLRRWFFGRGCLPMGLVSYNKTLVRVNSTALLARIGVSFWTVGQTLTMTSVGADHRAYQMVMTKGDPRYIVRPRRSLFGEEGTEIKIGPLQNGIRTLTGEKIQWYLASELRDRIRNTQVRVTVIDKLARKQYEVEPRQFEGCLLHQLPPVRSRFGEAYAELYLTTPSEDSRVAITKSGTRVIADLTTLPGLEHAPWTSRYLQGLIDVPYLNLTPGTRSGIVHDEDYSAFVDSLAPLEAHLNSVIEAQRRAEEEQANVLGAIAR